MSATLTITPANTQKLYIGQKLLVTVHVSNSVPLTAYSTVLLHGIGSGFAWDDTDTTTNFSHPQLVVPDPADSSGRTGNAKFILKVLPGTPGNVSNLQFTATPTGDLNGQAAVANYTTLGARINSITLWGALPSWVPVPPSSLPSPLTPMAGIDYTTSMYATVMDGNTPVPYYVVDWFEQPLPSGLLTNVFLTQYTYLHSYDTQPLTPQDQWPHGPLGWTSSNAPFVRTTTNANGMALLYVVANNHSGNAGQTAAMFSVMPYYDESTSMGMFMVSNLSPSNLQGTPIPGDVDQETGKVNFGFPGPDVPVSIPTQGIQPGDLIYTFINQHVGDYFIWSPDDSSILYQSKFPKVFGFTDTRQNELMFIQVTGSPSQFKISDKYLFHGENVPPAPE